MRVLLRSPAVFAALAAAASAARAQVREHPGSAFETPLSPFTTYVESDAAGTPTRVGLSIPDFDEGGLVLPASAEGNPPLEDFFDFDVGAPAQDDIPFATMGLNFLPDGHPGGFNLERWNEIAALGPGSGDFVAAYVGESPWMSVPHFDVHFHLNGADTVRSWECDTVPCQPVPGNEAFFELPPAGHMPDTHYPDLFAAVPRMGTHHERKDLPHTKENNLFLTDPPELWGSFGGQTAFIEVMPSLDAMRDAKANGPKTEAWSRPALAPKAGYWPRTWRIAYNNATAAYEIDLLDFEYRCAGECAVAGCGCTDAVASATGTTASLVFRDGAECPL